jgi:hypothetical protein
VAFPGKEFRDALDDRVVIIALVTFRFCFVSGVRGPVEQLVKNGRRRPAIFAQTNDPVRGRRIARPPVRASKGFNSVDRILSPCSTTPLKLPWELAIIPKNIGQAESAIVLAEINDVYRCCH